MTGSQTTKVQQTLKYVEEYENLETFYVRNNTIRVHFPKGIVIILSLILILFT